MTYLDHNATTPLHPAAREAWLEAAEHLWHNPSGLYAAATRARSLLDRCRERLADLLGVTDPGRIVFTSGATAACNLLARELGRTAPANAVAIISPIEHPAVHESFLAAFPGAVVEADCDSDGVVGSAAIDAALAGVAGRPVACVSVMAAGNESGVLQPWPDIAWLCRDRGIPFHTDASQWIGKLPATSLGVCPWVTGSGHKFGGPRGVGFLVVPADCPLRGDRGGPQEGGRHAGTENLPAIAGLVAALQARESGLADVAGRGATLRDEMIVALRDALPAAVVVSAGAERLWNTLAVLVPGADSRKLVAALDRAGIAASTGSACSAGAASAARIVAAIGSRFGGPCAARAGLVRLSAGPETTSAEWREAARVLADAAAARPPRITLG